MLRQELFERIESKEEFDELDNWQMATIYGMYWAMEVLENAEYEYKCDTDSIRWKLKNEIASEVLDFVKERLTCEIAEHYTAYMDDNACREMEEENE